VRLTKPWDKNLDAAALLWIKIVDYRARVQTVPTLLARLFVILVLRHYCPLR
jgi:hypothetical protein